MANTLTLQHLLYKEFISHMDVAESTAQVLLPDGYSYYSKKQTGKEYRLHCRRAIEGSRHEEEVYLDENEFVDPQNPSFFHCGFIRHSPCGRWICFGIDGTGQELYTGRFINMQEKPYSVSSDKIESMHIDVEFSRCGNYIYYVEIGEGERAYEIYRKKVNAANDAPQYVQFDSSTWLTSQMKSDQAGVS